MKTLKIVLIVIVMLCLIIWLWTSLINDKQSVEFPYINVDTTYIESNKRDSITKAIDIIFINLNNTKHEEELHEAIVDSDSIAIVRRFIELCSKPIR